MTLNINNAQQNVCYYAECRVLFVTECRYAEYRYAECHYAECRILFIIMLNVIMLSVVVSIVKAPSIN